MKPMKPTLNFQLLHRDRRKGTTMNHVSLLGRFLAMCGLALTVVAAFMTVPSAQAQQAQPRLAEADRITRVAIRVVGCNNCAINVSSNPSTVSRGCGTGPFGSRMARPSLGCRRRTPSGCASQSKYKNQGSTDNAANSVTVQHSTGTPGKRIRKSRALKAAYSYGCWAGTTRARVRLRMVVHKFQGIGSNGERVTDDWSYFSPQLGHYGTWGSEGHAINYQDRPPCDGDWDGGEDTAQNFLQKVLDEVATGVRGSTSTVEAVPSGMGLLVHHGCCARERSGRRLSFDGHRRMELPDRLPCQHRARRRLHGLRGTREWRMEGHVGWVELVTGLPRPTSRTV